MTAKNFTLTQERLKELLHYDPDTGVFTWKKQRGNARVGLIAGTKNNKWYIKIAVNQVLHSAHRLAFLYMNGQFPPDQVDHGNRIRNDNRWENLRCATAKENAENRSDNNKFIGVIYLKKYNSWLARSSKAEGKQKHLGQYKTHLAACYSRWAYDKGCRA